jgi:hypothetical protein
MVLIPAGLMTIFYYVTTLGVIQPSCHSHILAVSLLTFILLLPTLGLLYPEDGGSMFLQNIIIYIFISNEPQGITSQKTIVIFIVAAIRTHLVIQEASLLMGMIYEVRH